MDRYLERDYEDDPRRPKSGSVLALSGSQPGKTFTVTMEATIRYSDRPAGITSSSTATMSVMPGDQVSITFLHDYWNIVKVVLNGRNELYVQCEEAGKIIGSEA